MGWITANGERISIRKEIEWLESYIDWSREDANYSRRCHTAVLQADMLFVGSILFVNVGEVATAPWYARLLVVAAVWVYGFMLKDKADKAINAHAAKKPSTMFEGNFFEEEKA